MITIIYIIENLITNNTDANIFTYFSNNNTIQNNTLTNSATNSGINLATSHNNTITGNNVSYNGDAGIASWNSNNNIITDNNATNNINYGIYFYNSNNNTFKDNILTNTINYAGICLSDSSNNNTITRNTIKNNGYTGIVLYISNYTTITENDITDNPHGIYVNNASANIKFNRISGNAIHGLSIFNNGTVTANNNWWGTNNPVISSTSGSDIYIENGTATYDPWLILKVIISPSSTNGKYIITAGLTQNSNGDNTSSSGNIPDNIPLNFTTTLGTIETTTYTNRGIATSTLNCTTHGEANIIVALDNQNISSSIVYGVYNQATQTIYDNIQEAINDSETSPGDTIIIDNGTYNENIIINKKINLIAGNGANPSIIGSISINPDGNGSLIEGLTIQGNINLYANNCTVYSNTIIANGTSGIIIFNSTDNKIIHNNIISNGFNGIQSISSSNLIYLNTIDGCVNGIYSENSNNTIESNTIINNYCGIYALNSTGTVQFNKITQNTYGIKNEIGTINAINNWWGSNTPVVSIGPSDIYIVSGTVSYNPWLILNVKVSSTNSGGNTSVTADLTNNNQNEDTSSQGHIPDGTPINFVTDEGTIINQSCTIRGKASTILNLNDTTPHNVTVSASLDNQTVTTIQYVIIGEAILNITSTAIDNSTGQPLNITYNISLNEPITWLSIVWTPTTIPGISALADELQIIVNGNIILDKFIYNNNGLNKDTLTFNLTYPGISGFNITVTDPHDSSITNLNFPGNNINRTSQIVYTGSPYEGVKSFAIATTDVTTDLFNYWFNQYSNYQTADAMNIAYNTFLTALLVTYTHDNVANGIKSNYNVTWSRTSPVVISVCQDAFETYMTLECDHSMGMTVVGALEDIINFNFATSSMISTIEYATMNGVCDNPNFQSYSSNGVFNSVIIDIYYDYLFNKLSIETFAQNEFIIIKSIYNDDYFIVMDAKTGIVRDINVVNNFCGAYNDAQRYLPICIEFYEYSDPPDERVFVIKFWWDGYGQVLIGNSSNSIAADDELTIVGPNGTINEFYYNIWNVGPNIDITYILEEGSNTITVLITNIYPVMIGSTTLTLIQLYTNEDYQQYRNFDPYNYVRYNLYITIYKLSEDYSQFGPGGVDGEEFAPIDMLSDPLGSIQELLLTFGKRWALSRLP